MDGRCDTCEEWEVVEDWSDSTGCVGKCKRLTEDQQYITVRGGRCVTKGDFGCVFWHGPKPKDPRCEDCKWWHETAPEITTPDGWCLRLPQTVGKGALEWCGEFEPPRGAQSRSK